MGGFAYNIVVFLQFKQKTSQRY